MYIYTCPYVCTDQYCWAESLIHHLLPTRTWGEHHDFRLKKPVLCVAKRSYEMDEESTQSQKLTCSNKNGSPPTRSKLIQDDEISPVIFSQLLAEKPWSHSRWATPWHGWHGEARARSMVEGWFGSVTVVVVGHQLVNKTINGILMWHLMGFHGIYIMGFHGI